MLLAVLVRPAQKAGKSLQSSPVSTGGVAAALKKNVIDKSRLLRNNLKRRQAAPNGEKSLTAPTSFLQKSRAFTSRRGSFPKANDSNLAKALIQVCDKFGKPITQGVVIAFRPNSCRQSLRLSSTRPGMM